MSHALPDPDPQTTRPELFTASFWLIVIARVVRGAAVGGSAVIGAGHFDTLGSVPWSAFVTGCVIGAIMSLSASLGTMLIPGGTQPAVAARFALGQKR